MLRNMKTSVAKNISRTSTRMMVVWDPLFDARTNAVARLHSPANKPGSQQHPLSENHGVAPQRVSNKVISGAQSHRTTYPPNLAKLQTVGNGKVTPCH